MATRRGKKNGAGDNSASREEILNKALAKMDEIDAKRETLNAQMATAKGQIKEAGFHVGAVMASRQYAKLPPEKREGWDESYKAGREQQELPLFAVAAPAAELAESEAAGTA